MGDSSGTFTVDTDGTPVVDQTEIDPNMFNALLAELEAALSSRICKDGQTTITQNLPMNNKKLTGLLAGSALTDSCNLQNLIVNTGKYTATVGGAVDAITLTPSPAWTSYGAGMDIYFIASGANTGATTANISGLGNKAVTKNGATALSAGDIPSGGVIHLVYDGTRLQKI